MKTPVPLDDLDAMLKRLHMPTIRRLYPDLAIRAEEEGMSYRTFLELLVAEEIAHRAQTRITRSVRKARFPFLCQRRFRSGQVHRFRIGHIRRRSS